MESLLIPTTFNIEYIDWCIAHVPSRRAHLPTFTVFEVLILFDALIGTIDSFEKPLNEILSFKKYPQILTNIEVSDAEKIISDKNFKKLCKKIESEISEFDGKILIRKSGTEPLLRILVESKDSKVTRTYSKQLTELAKNLN